MTSLELWLGFGESSPNGRTFQFRERFKQHESEKNKLKGKGKGDPKKGDPKGKGKGDKGKKGSKVDSALVPPNLAQLSVAFTTQSVDTHVGVMPGHLLKVVQIGRDLTSVKMASTKADKVRFSAFLLMCMDVTALEIAVLSLYTRAEDTLVMPRGPGEWYELPVIHQHENFEWIQLTHAIQPAVDIPEPIYTQLHKFDMLGHTLQFYTDGSCQFPQSPNTRFSSFSMLIDLASDNEERTEAAKAFPSTGAMPATLILLNACRTQGEQTIHRAELPVILYLCERFYNTCIRTDSQVALNAIKRCQKATAFATLHDMDDLDLIYRLWCVIHIGQRHFHKVKAHAETQDNVTWLDLYHRLGNKKANDAAITACWHLIPTLVQEYTQMHHQLDTQ